MSAPLHPRGTLRARFAERPAIGQDLFRRLGVGARNCDLGDEGLYLAEELVAADVGWLGSSEHPEALAVLVLALLIAQRQGSTRVPLDAKGPLRGLVGDVSRVAGVELDVPRVLRTIGNLTRSPRFNSVIGMADARLPLVVDRDCVYTERSRWLEHRVATRLAHRLRAAARDVSAARAELAARPGSRPLSAEQQREVELALAGSLAVVTGGPGTGKTLVAAAIVRGFAALGVSQIALAAQTGKAANRLTEVIGEQLAAVGGPEAAATAPVAQTIHRLLGYRPSGFAHHAQSPLPVGAVIVDEASMLDLELIDALLDALPATAPLVLIGDANQLPAIDAGRVLADLAGGGATTAPSVAVLATSFRQDTADPAGRAVFDAARAIHDGDPARFAKLATTRTASRLIFSGVEWVDVAGAPRALDVTHQAAEAVWHHFGGPQALRAGEHVFRFEDGVVIDSDRARLEEMWKLLGRARILTVTRALPTGSIAINHHLHKLGLDRLSVNGAPELIPGEPVMMTANDYQRGLFNGDQGIVVRADEGLGRHHYRVVFRTGGDLRLFAIEALRDHLELAWALTIHKSQGSELDAVALLLPHEDLPLVTRELLYTGVTRARRSVVVAGGRPIFAAGTKRQALRESGLGERIAAILGRES